MTTVGNIDFKKIENRQFVTVDTEKAQEIISKLTQEDVLFSGRYDDSRLTLNFSKNDWEKINQVLNDVAVPNQKTTAAQQSLEELQKLVEELQQRQKQLEEQTQNTRQSQEDKNLPQKSDLTASLESSEPKPEHLLPILHAKMVKHAGKLESLDEKRAVLEDKIANNHAKIDRLSAKTEHLADTNQMLKSLFQDTKIPGVRALAESTIRRNEQKIAKIQKEKIPAHQAKIQRHTNKISSIDRKSAITQCKMNRCRSMNQLIKSFGIPNNAERRQEFAQAMDGLHQATSQTLTYKVDTCNQKISVLSQRYMETDSAADKLKIHQKINAQKKKKQKITAKLDRLHGVTKPYTQQPDIILDNIILKTEHQLKEAAETGKTEMPVLAEHVCISNVDFLPEIAISTPDQKPDQSLIPEIAGILNMSVSEIESKPQDIQMMLKNMYTANYFADPATLQETLTCIINPNYETKRDLEEHQTEKEKSLVVSAKEADSDNRKHEHSQEMPPGETTASSAAKNHLRSVEEMTEANANMIDGVLNNEKVKPEPEQEKPKKTGFSFSRSNMKALAAKVHDIPSNPPDKEKQRDEIKK